LEELSNLPPAAWVLIGGAAALGFGVSWLWRWYRQLLISAVGILVILLRDF
jgi:hypothetical protein